MRIFVLLPRVPFPLNKGDKLRAYHQIRVLSQKHDIYLFALSDNNKDLQYVNELRNLVPKITVFKLKKWEVYLNIIFCLLFTKKPIQTAYFFNSKAKRKINQIINDFKPDVVYNQLLRTAEYVKNRDDVHKVIDFQDAFSMGMKRRAEKSSGFMKMVFILEFKRLEKYEADIFNYFQRYSIISNPDRLLIKHPEKNDIEIIENGVDFDFFKPIDAKKEYDIVFTGNMNYPPNIKSAEYLANVIVKKLAKLKPDVKVLIAGASPHQRVKNLKSDNIYVSGWLEDIRDAYSKSKVFVAPMQIGTGLQNKLLEAMAMKIPCVTSELANNALNAKEEEEIFVGSSEEEYIKHITKLLDNSELAEKISLNAYKFVRENYSWEASVKKLEYLFVNEN